MLSQSGASRMTFDEGGGVEHAVGSGTIQGLRGNGTLSYQKGPAIVGAVAGSTGGSDADGCARDGEERRRVSPECGNADGEAGEGTLAEADPKDPVMYQLGRLAGEVSVLRDAVGILQGAVVTLQGAVGTLRKDMLGEIGSLRKDTHGEIGSLRKGMLGEIGSLRKDTHGEIGSLRKGMLGEIGSLRKDTHGEIGSLRKGMLGEIGSLRKDMLGEIGSLRKDTHGEIGSLRKDMLGEIGSLRDDLTRVAREAQEKQQSDFKFLIRLILVGICVPFYLSILGFLAHSIGLF